MVAAGVDHVSGDGHSYRSKAPGTWLATNTNIRPFRLSDSAKERNDMSKQLACPECESTRLRSDEVAAIGYPVRLFRTPDGSVDVDYTGESYQVWDEGTEYSGDIWCMNCGANPNEADLIEVEVEETTPWVNA
jgi:hypothetical protein